MLRKHSLMIVFRSIGEAQSYRHLLYLLVTLFLGCIYLFFLVGGFALGFVTMLVWIGIPLTLFMLLAVQVLASFERSMLRVWLRLDIPPAIPAQKTGSSLWQQLRSLLRSTVIWKNLAYLLVKALPGTLVTSLALSLFITSLLLIFVALAYIADIVIASLLHMQLLAQTALAGVTLSFVVPITPFAGLGDLPLPLALLRLGFTALLGLMIFVGSLSLGNGLMLAWGRFALLTLGASQSDLQLLEARRLAEQERVKAEKADQKRRELITNVSHELRTPVASIQGHVESLLKTSDEAGGTLPASEVVLQYLGIIHRESLRLGALVDDLLALARAETDELRLARTAVVGGEVVEDVYRSLMPLARRERQIILIQQVEPDLPPVLADRQRLTQVLLNLVRNAITSTPDGGIVSISLHQPDGPYLAFRVSDTGIGIPLADQERIFERFYRTDASRSRSSGGTGLGLAIVHDLVQAMGGSISVESTPGEGSTFQVLLHLARPLDL